jgi:hypothetical protein
LPSATAAVVLVASMCASGRSGIVLVADSGDRAIDRR